MAKPFSLRTLLIGTISASVLLGLYIFIDPLHDSVEKISAIQGKGIDEVLAIYGDPTDRIEFTMDKSVGEFRMSLYNIYPPDRAINSSIVVREYSWSTPAHTTTIWFGERNGRWSVIDSCRYKWWVQF